jgi:signal peptidase II
LWKTWKKNVLIFWGINLAISGGVGNLIDRIFNNGQVIDFIRLEFIDFPIFNVADISIVVGCGLIILSTVIDIVRDYKGCKSNIQNINLSK